MYLTENGKITKLKAPYLTENGKFVKLSKAWLTKDGKFVKLMGGEGVDYILNGVLYSSISTDNKIFKFDNDFNVIETFDLYNTRPDTHVNTGTVRSENQKYLVRNTTTYTGEYNATGNLLSTVVITMYKWVGDSYQLLYEQDIASIVKSKLKTETTLIRHSVPTGSLKLSANGDMLVLPVYTKDYSQSAFKTVRYTYLFFQNTDSGLVYKYKIEAPTTTIGSGTFSNISTQIDMSHDMSAIVVGFSHKYDSDDTVSFRMAYLLQSDGTYTLARRLDLTSVLHVTCDGKYLVSASGSGTSTKCYFDYIENGAIKNSFVGQNVGYDDPEIISPNYWNTTNYSIGANMWYNPKTQVVIQKRTISSSVYYLSSYKLSETSVTYLGKFTFQVPSSSNGYGLDYFYICDMSDDFQYILTQRLTGSSDNYPYKVYFGNVTLDNNSIITAVGYEKLLATTGSYHDGSYSIANARFIGY